MRVLVTGASSLIGRGVVNSLRERGDDVCVLQRRPANLATEEFLGDISDAEVVSRALAGCDGVIHLAARVGITGSWADFTQTNVEGTTVLLTAAKNKGVARFVHVSTPSVAHTGASIVGGAADPARPDEVRGHYARSKAMAEIDALEAADESMAVVAIRPHLVWGPGDTQLVGRMVERARTGRLAIIGSGAALIDTTYVDNAVSALTATLDVAPQQSGKAFVVSNGEPRPVRELIERILAAHGIPLPTLAVPPPVAKAAGTIAEHLWATAAPDKEPPITGFLVEQLATAHWFDQRTTREALNWAPSVTLEEGFRRLALSHQGA